MCVSAVSALILTFLVPAVLFYAFFEMSLIPLFFIVGIWGGKERRRAAMKLFLYTFAGSIFMLEVYDRVLPSRSVPTLVGLGILQVRKRAARMGRNPATGEAIKIKASKKARITPLKGFKDAVMTPSTAPKLNKGVWPAG